MVERQSSTEPLPVFLVSDIAPTMRWYASILGFDVQGVPESPPHTFGFLRKDNVGIFLQQLDGYSKPDLYGKREGGVWSVYIQVQDVRELYEQLSQAPDVTMLEPLCHQPYGQTEFVIRDPNGSRSFSLNAISFRLGRRR